MRHLLKKIYTCEMSVTDFDAFRGEIKKAYDEVKSNEGGKKADYIKALFEQREEHFGVSVCTIDGQRLNIGVEVVHEGEHVNSTEQEFSIQSCSKPITYAMALEARGEEKVHKHIGVEPSGMPFNHQFLDKDNLPHNPMINAGAIMASSLVPHQTEGKKSKDGNECKAYEEKRLDNVKNTWNKLAGNLGKGIDFSDEVYKSESGEPEGNQALAKLMRDAGAFPEWIKTSNKPAVKDDEDIDSVLQFYFKC